MNEKQIFEIARQYSRTVELALREKHFARAKVIIDEAEKLLTGDKGVDPLDKEIECNLRLTAAQIGTLQTHGFYFWHQFVGKSQSSLRRLENVGQLTVDRVAEYMDNCDSPMPLIDSPGRPMLTDATNQRILEHRD